MATFHLLETKEPKDGVLLGALLFGCIVSFVVRNLCHGTRYPPPAPNSCLKTWLVIKECTSRSHGNRYFDILWIENLSGYSCRVTVLQQKSVISYFALHAEQFHNRGVVFQLPMKLVCYFDIAKLQTRNISRPESVMFIKFGFPSKNGSAIWKFHLVSYDFAKWLQDLFFKEWVLGHVYNRRIKWLAAANCIKKIQESRGYVRTHRFTKLNWQRTPEMATKKFAAASRGHSL